jgi:hypothetical protein
VIETAIFGFSQFLRAVAFFGFMKNQNPIKKTPWYNFLLAPFFLVHFYAFVAIQSIFIFVIAEVNHSDNVTSALNLVDNFSHYLQPMYYVALAGFAANQLMITYSEATSNSITTKLDVGEYIMLPYYRIFIQQIIVIVGTFIFFQTKSITFVVVLLGVLKMTSDYLVQRYGIQWFVKKKI